MNPLEPFETAIGWVLAVFYSVVPNLGVSIILLTCAVMAVLLPLTAKQTRSMIAMQRIQPEIKKLQAQYKDDKQKQNEALMEFYKENNVNPLSGCLPLVGHNALRIMALFRVLRSIQDHIPTTGPFNDLFRDLCGNASNAAARAPEEHVLPRAEPDDVARELGQRHRQRHPAPAVLHRRRLRGRERLVPDVADPAPSEEAREQPEQPHEQADADDQPGLPDRVRLVLLDRGFRARALLRDEQPVADRSAAPRAEQVLRGAGNRDEGFEEGRVRRREEGSGRWRRRKELPPNKPATPPVSKAGRTAAAPRGTARVRAQPSPAPRRSGSAGAEPMEWIEVQAKSLDEAVELALDRLGVVADELEYEVIDEPAPGCSAGSAGERIRARVKPISWRSPPTSGAGAARAAPVRERRPQPQTRTDHRLGRWQRRRPR
jgi:YidC/Oxa1 family membrane protein insertase